MALSILGYRCCSDVTKLPQIEEEKLLSGKKGRIFNAYVNIGSLGPNVCVQLSELYPEARFITTGGADADSPPGRGSSSGFEVRSADFRNAFRGSHSELDELGQLRVRTENVLALRARDSNPWEALCGFLGCDLPNASFPKSDDLGQRTVTDGYERLTLLRARSLSADRSPWVVPGRGWRGIRLTSPPVVEKPEKGVKGTFEQFDGEDWIARDDTFPSNLALFKPRNVVIQGPGLAALTLQKERTLVREYTSGAICTRKSFQFGRFAADVKPSRVSGVITGMFLHRDSPRQEIDIEFLGKDTTKLLVNTYYNPGDEGARLDFGYRVRPRLSI